jgi:hypothetical protein
MSASGQPSNLTLLCYLDQRLGSPVALAPLSGFRSSPSALMPSLDLVYHVLPRDYALRQEVLQQAADVASAKQRILVTAK